MNKLEQLKKEIRSYKKVAIAYSGGCDSNFLYHVCLDVLGKENVYPILVRGSMMAEEDFQEALAILAGSSYSILDHDVFSIPQFVQNDKKRCYFCKKALMKAVIEEAKTKGIEVVFDGQNQDDQKEYRPGSQASSELGVLSPLAHLTKKEIREYSSKEYHLSTAFKPANACLASRFDYGRHLTGENLKRVEKAEAFLHSIGLNPVRVRDHQEIARIELDPTIWNQALEKRTLICAQLQKLGYRFVVLDLQGIRSGGYDHG